MRYLLILIIVLGTMVVSCAGPGLVTRKAIANQVVTPDHPTLKEATSPKVTGVPVRGLKWSPDGKLLGFLAPQSDKPDAPMALWVYDVKAQKRRILVKASDLVSTVRESEKEKARRERMRMSRSGIVEYDWSKDGKYIVFPLSRAVYLYDMDTGRAKQVPKTGDKAPEITPRMSVIHALAWSKKGCVYYSASGRKKSILKKICPKKNNTKSAINYGVAEFVAQEEMDRYRGLWWSKDGKRLLYTRVDTSRVPVRKRLEYGPKGARVVSQSYPAVGQPNAGVELYVSPGIRLDLGKYEYIARAGWLPDNRVYAVLQDRLQKHLRITACNADTGRCEDIKTIDSKTWVELNNDFKFGPKDFIWATEKPWGRTLELFDYKGKSMKTLPDREPLAELLRTDWDKGEAWYMVYADKGIRTRLKIWDFRHNRVRTVPLPAGWHFVVVAPGCERFVDKFSTISSPLSMVIRDRSGKVLAKISALVDAAKWLSSLPRPDFVSIPYQGGELNGLWFKADIPTRRTIVYVYGGPHGHMVRDAMRGSMLWNQWFARQGFNVLVVDGRGGLYKDRAFAKAPYHAFGRYEVQDARAIARYLDARGIPGQCRAIWGWSYGGYTVLAILTASDIFAAGAAVAPPSDWTLYDTHYTERYMGLNRKDYQASKITLKRLKHMKARFLLVHGMSDDNVLLVNSLRVIYDLQSIPRAFRLMLYPGKAHSLWGDATRRHLLRTLGDFFHDAIQCDSALSTDKTSQPPQP